MKKYLLSVATFALLHATVALSQTLVLTCKVKIPENYFTQSSKFWIEQCTKKPDKFNCEQVEIEKAQSEKCLTSGLDYLNKKIYKLDKSVLNSTTGGSAEVINHTCWTDPDGTRKVVVEATPSLISFKQDKSSFNIDRGTLSAGFEASRSYACEVKEVFVNNKI